MKKMIGLSLLLSMLIGMPIYAGEFCPYNVQAVMLTKVISFTRELGGATKGEVKMGVFGSSEIKAQLEQAAGKTTDKITVSTVSLDNISSVNVVYVPKGTPAELIKKIKEAAVANKVLTVGGDPQYVLDFALTLTFHLVDGKPRILISLESADEEGAKFAAELLKIAERK